MKNVKIYLVATMLLSVMSLSVQAQTITELAENTEQLSTLNAAIEAAGLEETLSGKGPFTVFAPTNEAFEALPDGALENLLKPENKQMLISVLTYHVVGGKVMSGDLKDGSMAKTVEGSDVKIMVGPKVKINNATVLKADIKAENGVVHIIDTLILPPSLQ